MNRGQQWSVFLNKNVCWMLCCFCASLSDVLSIPGVICFSFMCIWASRNSSRQIYSRYDKWCKSRHTGCISSCLYVNSSERHENMKWSQESIKHHSQKWYNIQNGWIIPLRMSSNVQCFQYNWLQQKLKGYGVQMELKYQRTFQTVFLRETVSKKSHKSGLLWRGVGRHTKIMGSVKNQLCFLVLLFSTFHCL